MSDFDKFFAKKLDEEGQFPRREKNWRAVSKRLDAFDAGASGTTSHLRYWQIAAVAALVAIGWLAWKTISVQSENAELRREVAVLQEKNKAAELEVVRANKGNKEKELRAVIANGAGTRNEDDASNFRSEMSPPRSSEMTLRPRPISDGESVIHLTTHKPDISNTIVHEEKTISGNVPTSPDSLVERKTDLTNFQNLSNLDPLPADSLKNTVVASQAKPAPMLSHLPQPDALVIDTAQKIIEPVKKPSRFRVGIQALAGTAQPREKGVSLITGQGLTAEFALWRGISLTASADWLRFDVSTDKYHPRFHPNNPEKKAPPPPWFYKLDKVEGSQRQQYYGLGLRYSLPVRFWLRPSVRVTHTWVRVSPNLLSFKYEKKFPPPPNIPNYPWYIVKNCEAKQLNNVWRFGVGLEHETQRWAFGLWADYSDNFAAADAMFDALTLRAGAQYKFN